MEHPGWFSPNPLASARSALPSRRGTLARARARSSLNRSGSSERNPTADRKNRCGAPAAEAVEVAVVESPASYPLEIQLYLYSWCSISCASQSIPFCCIFCIKPNHPAVNKIEIVNQSKTQSKPLENKKKFC